MHSWDRDVGRAHSDWERGFETVIYDDETSYFDIQIFATFSMSSRSIISLLYFLLSYLFFLALISYPCFSCRREQRLLGSIFCSLCLMFDSLYLAFMAALILYLELINPLFFGPATFFPYPFLVSHLFSHLLLSRTCLESHLVYAIRNSWLVPWWWLAMGLFN